MSDKLGVAPKCNRVFTPSQCELGPAPNCREVSSTFNGERVRGSYKPQHRPAWLRREVAPTFIRENVVAFINYKEPAPLCRVANAAFNSVSGPAPNCREDNAPFNNVQIPEVSGVTGESNQNANTFSPSRRGPKTVADCYTLIRNIKGYVQIYSEQPAVVKTLAAFLSQPVIGDLYKYHHLHFAELHGKKTSREWNNIKRLLRRCVDDLDFENLAPQAKKKITTRTKRFSPQVRKTVARRQRVRHSDNVNGVCFKLPGGAATLNYVHQRRLLENIENRKYLRMLAKRRHWSLPSKPESSEIDSLKALFPNLSPSLAVAAATALLSSLNSLAGALNPRYNKGSRWQHFISFALSAISTASSIMAAKATKAEINNASENVQALINGISEEPLQELLFGAPKPPKGVDYDVSPSNINAYKDLFTPSGSSDEELDSTNPFKEDDLSDTNPFKDDTDTEIASALPPTPIPRAKPIPAPRTIITTTAEVHKAPSIHNSDEWEDIDNDEDGEWEDASDEDGVVGKIEERPPFFYDGPKFSYKEQSFQTSSRIPDMEYFYFESLCNSWMCEDDMGFTFPMGNKNEYMQLQEKDFNKILDQIVTLVRSSGDTDVADGLNEDLRTWFKEMVVERENDKAQKAKKKKKNNQKFWDQQAKPESNDIAVQGASIVTCLFALVACAYGFDKSSFLTKLPTSFNFITSLVKNGKSTYGGVKDFVASAFFGAEDPREALKDEITKTVEQLEIFRKKEVQTIYEDPDFQIEFPALIRKARKLLSDLDRNHALHMYLTAALTRAENAWGVYEQAINNQPFKQTPTCTLIYGDEGVGKSHLKNWLADQIHKNKYNSRGSIYTISATDKYFGPYIGERVAKSQEFAVKLDMKDDILANALTSIISEDFISLESAFVKHQPCRIETLILDSNVPPQELLQACKINQHSHGAFASRIFWIEAQWKGGNEAIKNINRNVRDFKNDYSHLTLTPMARIAGDGHFAAWNWFPFAYPKLWQELRGVADPGPAATFRVTMLAWIEQQDREVRLRYQNLAHKLRNGILPDEILKVEHYFWCIHRNAYEKRLKPYLAKRELWKQQSKAEAGKGILTINLHGPPEGGKSTLIDAVKTRLLSNPALQVLTPRTAMSYRGKEPVLYIVDDFIMEDENKELREATFFEQYNNLPDGSIVIFASNLVPKYQYNPLNWKLGSHYVEKIGFNIPVPQPTYQPLFNNVGTYRRAGYHGTFAHDTYSVSNENDMSFLCKNFSYISCKDGQIWTLDSIIQLIENRWKQALQSDIIPNIVHRLHPVAADIKVSSPSLAKLGSDLSSKVGLTKILLGAATTKIHFSARVAEKAKRLEFSDFYMPNTNNIEDLARHFIRKLRFAGISESLEVNIADTGMATCVGNNIYLHLFDNQGNEEIEYDADRNVYRINGEEYSPDQIVTIMEYPKSLGVKKHLLISPETKEQIRYTYTTFFDKDHFKTARTTVRRQEKEKLKLAAFAKVKGFFEEWGLLTLVAVGTTVIVGVILGLVHKFTSRTDEDELNIIRSIVAQRLLLNDHITEPMQAVWDATPAHQRKQFLEMELEWINTFRNQQSQTANWVSKTSDWDAKMERKKKPLDWIDYDDPEYKEKMKKKFPNGRKYKSWRYENNQDYRDQQDHHYNRFQDEINNMATDPWADEPIDYNAKIIWEAQKPSWSIKQEAVKVPLDVKRNTGALKVYEEQIAKNLVKVSTVCYGIGLWERFVLVPRHALRVANTIRDERTDFTKDRDFPFTLAKDWENRDVAIVRITDPSFPAFRDIRHLLVSEEEHISTSELCDIFLRRSDVVVQNTFTINDIVREPIRTNSKFYLPTVEKMACLSAQSDAKPTEDGDCGSPYVLTTRAKFGRPCLFGIHCAGTYPSAEVQSVYAGILFREDLYGITTATMKNESQQIPDGRVVVITPDQHEALVKRGGAVKCDDTFKNLGGFDIYYVDEEKWRTTKKGRFILRELNKKIKPEALKLYEKADKFFEQAFEKKFPSKVPFEKVAVIGTVDRTLAPAPRSKAVKTNAYPVAVKHLGPPKRAPIKTVNEMSQEELDKLPSLINGEKSQIAYNTLMLDEDLPEVDDSRVERLVDLMLPVFKAKYGKYCRFLPEKYVLNGLSANDFGDWPELAGRLHGLETDSSVGFQAKQFLGITKKSQVIKTREDGKRIWLDTPKAKALRDTYFVELQGMKDNIRPRTLFTTTRKVENLPQDKRWKGRVFEAPDLVQTLIERTIFGLIVAEASRPDFEDACRVGIDARSEWHLLANFHNRFKKHFAGDFTRFDKKAHAKLLLVTFKLVEACSEDLAYKNAVRALYRSIVLSRRIVENAIIQLGKGVPSGTFLTAWLDSRTVETSFFDAFVDLTGWADYGKFKELTAHSDNGDDNLTSVADEIAEQYNLVTISEHLKNTWGMVLGSDRKDGTLVPYTGRLEECTLLSRHFRSLGGWTVGALKQESIEAPLYWTTPAASSPEHLAMRCENALFEAACWGEKYFNKIRRCCEEIAQMPINTKAFTQHPLPSYNMCVSYALASIEESGKSNLKRIKAFNLPTKSESKMAYKLVDQFTLQMDDPQNDGNNERAIEQWVHQTLSSLLEVDIDGVSLDISGRDNTESVQVNRCQEDREKFDVYMVNLDEDKQFTFAEETIQGGRLFVWLKHHLMRKYRELQAANPDGINGFSTVMRRVEECPDSEDEEAELYFPIHKETRMRYWNQPTKPESNDPRSVSMGLNNVPGRAIPSGSSLKMTNTALLDTEMMQRPNLPIDPTVAPPGVTDDRDDSVAVPFWAPEMPRQALPDDNCHQNMWTALFGATLPIAETQVDSTLEENSVLISFSTDWNSELNAMWRDDHQTAAFRIWLAMQHFYTVRHDIIKWNLVAAVGLVGRLFAGRVPAGTFNSSNPVTWQKIMAMNYDWVETECEGNKSVEDSLVPDRNQDMAIPSDEKNSLNMNWDYYVLIRNKLQMMAYSEAPPQFTFKAYHMMGSMFQMDKHKMDMYTACKTFFGSTGSGPVAPLHPIRMKSLYDIQGQDLIVGSKIRAPITTQNDFAIGQHDLVEVAGGKGMRFSENFIKYFVPAYNENNPVKDMKLYPIFIVGDWFNMTPREFWSEFMTSITGTPADPENFVPYFARQLAKHFDQVVQIAKGDTAIKIEGQTDEFLAQYWNNDDSQRDSNDKFTINRLDPEEGGCRYEIFLCTTAAMKTWVALPVVWTASSVQEPGMYHMTVNDPHVNDIVYGLDFFSTPGVNNVHNTDLNDPKRYIEISGCKDGGFWTAPQCAGDWANILPDRSTSTAEDHNYSPSQQGIAAMKNLLADDDLIQNQAQLVEIVAVWQEGQLNMPYQSLTLTETPSSTTSDVGTAAIPSDVHYAFVKWLDEQAHNDDDRMTFDLVDLTGSVIAVATYERTGGLQINATDNLKALAVNNLSVQNIKHNQISIALTDTSRWQSVYAARNKAKKVQRFGVKKRKSDEVDFWAQPTKPEMDAFGMIGGSILGGIGSGLSGYYQRQWDAEQKEKDRALQEQLAQGGWQNQLDLREMIGEQQANQIGLTGEQQRALANLQQSNNLTNMGVRNSTTTAHGPEIATTSGELNRNSPPRYSTIVRRTGTDVAPDTQATNAPPRSQRPTPAPRNTILAQAMANARPVPAPRTKLPTVSLNTQTQKASYSRGVMSGGAAAPSAGNNSSGKSTYAQALKSSASRATNASNHQVGRGIDGTMRNVTLNRGPSRMKKILNNIGNAIRPARTGIRYQRLTNAHGYGHGNSSTDA